MNKKISQFTEVINLTENAYIPIIQGTPLDDYIISKGNLFNEISSGGASKDYVDDQDAILNAKIDIEIQNRINDDLTIADDLTFEISERIAADSNLEEIIVQETEDRIVADANLQNNIDIEIGDREATDSVLDGKISTEISNRISADTTLQNNINGKANIVHTHNQYLTSETDPVWLAEKSGYSQTGHTHDDRYFTESEITTLLSGKSDTSHLHTGIYSSLAMNVLTAGAGATEYTLLRNVQTNILNTLPSGVNSTITLPNPVAGELNESVLHFSTGGVVPTFVYNTFTPVWLGGTALSLKINKTYTVIFEQVRTSTGVWMVKTSFGEY